MSDSESEIEGLTPYDLVRETRPVVTDDRTLRVDVRSLNVELTCPVCLGILRNTVTVRECLHRFCDGCMQKCLRVGKKECPKCRIKVPSRRSLKRDSLFDSLIAQIYPDLDVLEKQHDKQIAFLNKKMNFNNQFTKSSLQGAAQQDEVRRGKKPAPSAAGFRFEPSPAPVPAPAPQPPKKKAKPAEPSSAAAAGGGGGGEENVKFILARHPSETHLPALERALLQTSNQFPISRVKKFLSLKMNGVGDFPPSSFRISVGKDLTTATPVVVEDEETLQNIFAAHWKQGEEPLVLHYTRAG